MTEDVHKIYVRNLPEWEAKGWRPSLNADGQIVVHDSPTGAQMWVWRPVAQSPVGRTDWMAGVLEGD